MATIKDFIKLHKPLTVKKGRFSTVYIYKKSVLIDTTDKIKECMARGLFPASRLFLSVHAHLLESVKKDGSVYIAKRVETSRSVKSILSAKDYFLSGDIYLSDFDCVVHK